MPNSSFVEPILMTPPPPPLMHGQVYNIPTQTEETDDYQQFSVAPGNIFVPCGKTVKKIPPGVYELIPQNGPPGFQKIPVKTEGLIRFPETNSNEVITEICKFWEQEALFNKYNLVYKRGIILYGPAGVGKSATIQLIIQDVVRRNGIVINFQNPYDFIHGFRIFRKIEPTVPVVVIMEDIDSIIDTYNESDILNILDGVNNVNKVVFLATTNYPRKLGQRIMNRPSRFDRRYRIGYPSDKSRKLYFESLFSKDNLDNFDIKKWVADTDRLSIAHLKELFVSVVILGNDYNDVIRLLQSMKEQVDESEHEGFGFVIEKPKNIYD
jgi:hypothetical protein